MLFEIPELEQHVWLSAFEAKPKSIDHILQGALGQFPEVCIQLVDLDRVPGSRYLFMATYNAVKSYRSKQPISKSLAMEVLLFISGNRQINEALKQVGVTSDTSRTGALAIGNSKDQVMKAGTFVTEAIGGRNMDNLLDHWTSLRIENVRSGFGIADKEIRAIIRKKEPVASAIERLAVERSAMLAVRK